MIKDEVIYGGGVHQKTLFPDPRPGGSLKEPGTLRPAAPGFDEALRTSTYLYKHCVVLRNCFERRILKGTGEWGEGGEGGEG